jgi:hypothetical protein
MSLYPRIPLGTKVVVACVFRDGCPDGKSTVWLSPNKGSSVGEIKLHPGVALQVLKQAPGGELYVQVSGNSSDLGKTGWVWRIGLHTENGNSLVLCTPQCR